MSIRDDLDPALVVRVADRVEPCLFCQRPTRARATTPAGEPCHYLCLARPMWLALAKSRGEIQTAGTWWGETSAR